MRTDINSKKDVASKYKPEYCKIAEEIGSKGKSKYGIAAAIGVSRPTIDAWEEVHAEFSVSLKKSESNRQDFYENLFLENMCNEKFNVGVAAMLTRNVVGWRTRDPVEPTVINVGGNIVGLEDMKRDAQKVLDSKVKGD